MGILVNPSGITVEVDDSDECLKLLARDGFRNASDEEVREFKKGRDAGLNKKRTKEDGIFFYAPCNKPNGFGTTQEILRESLLNEGIYLNNVHRQQNVGMVFSSPNSLDILNTPVKIIYTMFESTKIPRGWVELLKDIDLIMVPSKFCREAFKERGIDTKVIPLGYNDNEFFFKEKSAGEYFTFLHYDAFNTRKGWDIVFKAFDSEFKKDENVRLILKTVRSELPISIPRSEYPNITVIKEIFDQSELRKLNWQADCFVFPSRGEGFGLTPLESLACGTVPIIPNGSGMSEYFDKKYFLEIDIKDRRPAIYENYRNEDVGDFIEPDILSLRRQMRFAYNNRKKIHKMGQEGADWAKRNYSIKNTAKALRKEIEDLCRRKRVKITISKDNARSITESNENSIVFLSEDTQHITGGRYYSWWLATALKEAGHDVVIYTNRMPIFIDEFREYEQPEIRIVGNLRAVDVLAKSYFGSPIIGNEVACKLGEKYGKPSYCEIFDPFPMMEKYKGKHNWPGWEELLTLLRKKECNIISLCKTTSSYIYDWLNKDKDKVFDVYPCINTREKDKAKRLKKKNWITFISRLDHHKNVDHVLDAVKETDCELHVITSIDGVNFPRMVKERDMNDRVFVHKFATDKEKFEIINQSVATINGSIFEGFGMWLTESLSCGVPAVCYEYPTFREIESSIERHNRLVYYADYNDPISLKKTLKRALREGKKTRGTKKFDFGEMVKRVNEVVSIRPKIGIVTIVLNEQEYIGASLTSMLKQRGVEKIAVVEGCVNLYGTENPELVNRSGLSIDNTKREILKIIKKDNEGKIIYDRYGWARDKSELRNRCLELLGSEMDYILVVDGDEVWKEEDFDKLIEFVSKNPDYSTIWFPTYHFWKKPDILAVDSQWDNYLFRFFKYEDKTLHWENHASPVVNTSEIPVNKLGKEKILNDVHFYHYGAMKESRNILGKLKFYKARDKVLTVKDTWSKWKQGGETQWTHGGGTVKKFTGKHPVEVKNIISKK